MVCMVHFNTIHDPLVCSEITAVDSIIPFLAMVVKEASFYYLHLELDTLVTYAQNMMHHSLSLALDEYS